LGGRRLVGVKQFQSRVVVLGEVGAPTLEPVQRLAASMGERDLEALIVNHPELLGEELPVLGSQLAESAEDRDRLDVLAVDRDGELVLVELKVDGAFRVTDLPMGRTTA
jgi:RecB family endonuclease NucS